MYLFTYISEEFSLHHYRCENPISCNVSH